MSSCLGRGQIDSHLSLWEKKKGTRKGRMEEASACLSAAQDAPKISPKAIQGLPALSSIGCSVGLRKRERLLWS